MAEVDATTAAVAVVATIIIVAVPFESAIAAAIVPDFAESEHKTQCKYQKSDLGVFIKVSLLISSAPD